MDQDRIRAALATLTAIARSPADREALSELGAQALQRLGMLDLSELPEGVDRDGVAGWTVSVANDLLQAGAFVDGSPRQRLFDATNGGTPLGLAAQHQNWALAKALVDGGADPSPAFPALSGAVADLDPDAMAHALRTLDATGLSADGKDVLVRVKQRLLHDLSDIEDCEPAEQRLAAVLTRVLLGGESMTPDEDATERLDAALMSALGNGNWPMVLELVQRGANPQRTIPDDGISVARNILDADPVVATALLEHLQTSMLDPNLVRQVVLNQLDSVWTDDARVGMAQRLMAMGLAAPTDGMVLVQLAQYERPLCAQMLIDAGANLQFTTTKELRVMQRPDLGMGVRARPTLDARVHHGYTALHAAAKSGHLGIVEVLLRAGMPVNATTDGGVTALHLAAQSDATRVMRRLAQAGAALDPTDSNGRTPLDWASPTGPGREVMLQMLESGVLQAAVQDVPLNEADRPRPRL